MLKLIENNAGPGGGVEEFQWSTSEQVWPFEKGPSGQTLYAKQVDFGALPNNGTKTVNHGISSFDSSYVFKSQFSILWPNTWHYEENINHAPVRSINSTQIRVVVSDTDSSFMTARVRIIYAKSSLF